MPLQVELAILILGMITFIASGGVVIDLYVVAASSDSGVYSGQKTLALGSMCIITGLVFFVDVVFTALDISKYEALSSPPWPPHGPLFPSFSAQNPKFLHFQLESFSATF